MNGMTELKGTALTPAGVRRRRRAGPPRWVKKTALILAPLILAMLCGCGSSPGGTEAAINAGNKIQPLDLHRTTLDFLPSYNPYSLKLMQVDLRGYDLTHLDIHNRYEDLIHADFDTATKWPYWLPEGFNPKRLLIGGKNPGLGIKSLHERGIDGRGVGVAIIDDALLPLHEEYRDRIMLYEDISGYGDHASVSGCRQASILVGKETGVAPGADLYYFSARCEFSDATASKLAGSAALTAERTWAYEPLVSALYRVIDINNSLGSGNRIRVVCIGQDIPDDLPGYHRFEQVVGALQRAGVFVVSTLLYRTSGYVMDFNGLGRNPLDDADDISRYVPAHSWEYDLYTFGRYVRAEAGLLVPMDSRTAAAPTGNNRYAYYAEGDQTVCVPYIGGLYALACQANPDITPKAFWEAALKTGVTLSVRLNKLTFKYGKVVNPCGLIDEISGRR